MRFLRLFSAGLIFVAILLALVFVTSVPRDEIARLQIPGADTPTGDPNAPAATSTFTPTPEPDGIDTTAPAVISIELSQFAVDTTSSSQIITVSLHITDDLSGLRIAKFRFVPVADVTQFLDFAAYDSSRTDGDRRNGVYVTASILPKYSVHGRWYLQRVYVSDNAGNSIDSYALGPVEASAVADTVLPYFVNGEDSGTPTLTPIEPVSPPDSAAAIGTPWAEEMFIPAVDN